MSAGKSIGQAVITKQVQETLRIIASCYFTFNKNIPLKKSHIFPTPLTVHYLTF
jgi:hypothetical protein